MLGGALSPDPEALLTDTADRRTAARAWFEALRDRIRAEFLSIERGAGSGAEFVVKPWDRPDPSGTHGGGGVMSLLRGRVFEKAGVNVSTVQGSFAPEFAGGMRGASVEQPGFFATGISLVVHPANPHVPAVHMNTRYLETTTGWFGGGADLNPSHPDPDDTAAFHAALEAACATPPGDYPRYRQWAEEYFWLPHRQVARGVGGIFYDHLDSGDWAADFAFTQAVGEAFLAAYPPIVRRRMGEAVSDEDRRAQLTYRGRYAEFNLLHDRGTIFGLKTGGNIEAILMSLPPLATW